MDSEAIQGIQELLNNKDAFKMFSKDRFEHCDLDGNGLIDSSELEKALIDVHQEMKAPKPTKEYVQKILVKFDTDKSGKLDPKEFDSFTKFVLESFVSANK